MKRHNIYLYEYNGDIKGKNAGFCRMDVSDGRIKIALNIKNRTVGIEPSEIVEIKGILLFSGGKSIAFACDKKLLNTERLIKEFEVRENYDINSISLTYYKANGIKIKLQGLLEFPKSERIKQIELEDTVYNVDAVCLEKKRAENIKKPSEAVIRVLGLEKELIKVKLEEITSLPRSCWKLARNKFLFCNCNRFGYFAYMKQGDEYIICVPGIMDNATSSCANRFGFKSYFFVDDKQSQEDGIPGYWIMKF